MHRPYFFILFLILSLVTCQSQGEEKLVASNIELFNIPLEGQSSNASPRKQILQKSGNIVCYLYNSSAHQLECYSTSWPQEGYFQIVPLQEEGPNAVKNLTDFCVLEDENILIISTSGFYVVDQKGSVRSKHNFSEYGTHAYHSTVGWTIVGARPYFCEEDQTLILFDYDLDSLVSEDLQFKMMKINPFSGEVEFERDIMLPESGFLRKYEHFVDAFIPYYFSLNPRVYFGFFSTSQLWEFDENFSFVQKLTFGGEDKDQQWQSFEDIVANLSKRDKYGYPQVLNEEVICRFHSHWSEEMSGSKSFVSLYDDKWNFLRTDIYQEDWYGNWSKVGHRFASERVSWKTTTEDSLFIYVFDMEE